MPPKNKTRSSTYCEMIGPPADLPPSDLPTLKQVLQKCAYVKLNLKVLNKATTVSVAKELIQIWKSVNPNIPLTSKVQRKVKRSYDDYLKLTQNHINNSKKEAEFRSKLDKLFDICSCHCSFIEHSNKCELNCKTVHINCNCHRDYKIPVIELNFIKDQRDKVGPTGKFQLGSVDTLFEKKRKRTESRYHKHNKKMDLGSEVDFLLTESLIDVRISSTSSEDSADPVDSTYEPPVFASLSESIDLSDLAREADRYCISDRATAALATALLISIGKVSKSDTNGVITRSMIRSAREKYRKTVEILSDKPISAVYFDGRKDETRNKAVDESGVMRYNKIKEEHYVLTSEPDGTYMTHIAPTKGTAKCISDAVYAAMETMKVTDSIELIGSDSTSTMSGAVGGAQHFLEVRLNRNLFRVFCLLHTNELPLRNLFTKLDGKTSGKDSFKGPIGKALSIIKSYTVRETFPAITDGDSIPILPRAVQQDLSWDQKCQYKLLQAVRSGVSNCDIINMKIGGLNHSRWLTLACRVLYLYMCNHDLTEQNNENLKKIVQFIMTNYGPMWFHIKMKPLISDAPKHIYLQTKLLKLLPQDVLQIVKPYVSRNCYHAHPENLLLSMLDDDDDLVRKKAVCIIQDIRSRNPGRHVRSFKVPELLYNATSYHELIDWEKETLTEPPLTYSLTDDMLKKINDEPFNVLPYISHTQSVERAIKLVTTASGLVYGLDSARGFIKSQISSRNKYKKCDTKYELVKML